MATVSEYIFKFLANKGIKNAFMVSGSSAMWLTDALKRNNEIKVICNHHEQACTMAADAYGRITNKPGVALVTIGPGATNAITGVAEAYVDSSPIIVLSGQASSRLLDYEIKTGIRQHGTQSLNLGPIVSSITKYFATVMKPEDIRYHMEKAYYEAMEGRKGPVWLDVPVDIQNKQIPDEMVGYEPANDKKYDISKIDEVIDLILKSKKPLILAGYGVRSSGMVNEFRRLIERLDIPVVTSRGGIDVINSDNKLFIGRPGAYGDRGSHFAIQKCDLLIILGSRLSVSTIGYYPQRFAPNATKIMVDIDNKELDKEDVPVDIKINMSLERFLQEIYNRTAKLDIKLNNEWNESCCKLRDKYPNVLDEYKAQKPLNSYYFTSVLSKYVPDNAVVIVDTGSVCNIVSQSLSIKKEQRYLISGGLSCMGFWASSIGASICCENVVAITGDGSAQMNIQEFATIKYSNLPIKLFIYNNNGYMLIRHNQHNYMNDRFLGVGPDSGLQTPDFCAVADAYGLKSIKITSNDNIDEKLNEVFRYEGPVICEIIVQEFGEIVPKIASRVMPDGSLKAAEFDDLYPFLPKDSLDNI